MARRRKEEPIGSEVTTETRTTRRPLVDDAEEVAEEQVTEGENELEQKLSGIDLDSEAAVRIYTMKPNQRPGYVRCIPIGAFNFDQCVDELSNQNPAGGDYEFRFIHGGDRKGQIAKRVPVRIEPNPQAKAAQERGNGIPVVTQQKSELPELLAMIQTQSAQTTQILVQQNAQLMTVLAESIKSRGNSQQPAQGVGISEILKLVPVIRDLIAQRADPVTSKLLNSMSSKLLRQLEESDDAPRSGKSGIMEKLLELLPAAMAGQSQFAAPASGQVAAPSMASSTPGAAIDTLAPAEAVVAAGNPNANSLSAAGAELTPDMFRLLVIQAIRKEYLPMLIKAAAKGTEAASYFDIIVDKFEDENPEALDVIIDILKQPDWCQTLFGQPVLENQAWFDGLRKEFLDYDAEEPNKP